MTNMTLLEHYEIFERNLVIFTKRFIKAAREKGYTVGFSREMQCDYRVSFQTIFPRRYPEEFVGAIENDRSLASQSFRDTELLMFQIVSNAKPIEESSLSLTITAKLDVSRVEEINLTLMEVHPLFALDEKHQVKTLSLKNWPDVLNKQANRLSSKL